MDDDSEMRMSFEQLVFKIKNKKTQNCALLTRQEYNAKLQRLLELENPSVNRSPGDYKLQKSYDYVVQEENGRQTRRLVKKGTTYFCVPIEELYGILKSAHIQLRHAGRNAMQLFFRDKYSNVTKDCIMAYLSLCKQCPRKKKIREVKLRSEDGILAGMELMNDDDDEMDGYKDESTYSEQHKLSMDNGLGTTHETSSSSNENFSRGHVDVIDMRDHHDGDFTHILKYINLQTNEIRLRAMQYGTPSEAANLLVDIYCEQGAPVVLQSMNGREFVQEIVGEIVKIWPNCKQLHGMVRLNSGVSDHFGDQIVLEQLINMQKRLKTNVWAQLLRFLQWEINSSFNNELGRSTFESVFGKPPSLGLPTSKLLEAVYDKAQSEEQMMDYIADAELLRLSAFCSNACQTQQSLPRIFPSTSATASVSVSTGHFLDESQLIPAKTIKTNGSYLLQSTNSSSSIVPQQSPVFLDYQSLQMSVEAERAAQIIPPTPPQQEQTQQVFITTSQVVTNGDLGVGQQTSQQHYLTEMMQFKGEITEMDNTRPEHYNL